jgi:cation diffusion facilitator CzcD-associated flavoprotein CzcO
MPDAARPFHVAIIGSGFSGLCMAIRLKQAGVDFTIFEEAAGVGGTWRDNTYPGAACDIQSHLYSFSFEPNPRWSRMFPAQPEILAYLNHCADQYGLRPHLRLNTAVSAVRFDEARGDWSVHTAGGEALRANAVVCGIGGLSRPALPDLPGLASFAGHQFHSARWDHSYDLSGKSVAIVGTGASCIQFAPQIAPRVRQLHLFQRTPPWILPKPDRPISRFEHWLFQKFPWTQRVFRKAIYCALESRALGFVVTPRLMAVVEWVARRHLRQQVPEAALRARLTPAYTLGCKRILISNDFYPALARPNVELVTEAIREIVPQGVVTADGRLRQVDVLIHGTGFVAADTTPVFEVAGRGGRTLAQAWNGAPEAYLGTSVAGFPNWFMIIGPNVTLGHSSMVYMIESQVRYILDALQVLRRQGLRWLDVKPAAQRDYNAALQRRLQHTVWTTGCSAWYRTRQGKITTLWPGFTFEFRWRTRRLAAADYETR